MAIFSATEKILLATGYNLFHVDNRDQAYASTLKEYLSENIGRTEVFAANRQGNHWHSTAIDIYNEVKNGKPDSSLGMTSDYGDRARDISPRIAHIISCASHGWNTLMAAKSIGAKTIYDCRMLAHHAYGALFPWRKESKSSSGFRKLELEACSIADAVIVHNRQDLRELSENGIAAHKICLIADGIDSRIFSPALKNRALADKLGISNEFIAGYASGVGQSGGLEQLVYAVCDLNARGKRVKLLVMGEGPEIEYAKALCINLNAKNFVVFASAAPHDKMPEYYSLMDIITAPWLQDTVTERAASQSILEGMSMGIAPLVSNIPGLMEIVGHMQTGLVCQPGDSAQIANLIGQIYDDQDLRARIGAEARKYISGNRCAENCIESLVKVYTGLVPDDSGIHRRIANNYPAAGQRDISRSPSGPWLKIATVMDEFSFANFRHECLLLQLEPDKWQQQMDTFRPDMLFLESAWHGKNHKWIDIFAKCAEPLPGLIKYCRKKSIPVVFWNKEDPPSYQTFLPVATYADYIFTTDIDCIAKYKRDTGNQHIYLLPFPMQPRLTNPLEKYDRLDKFCFAGSWYQKFPERQRDFDVIFEVANKFAGMDIYDRNHGLNLKGYVFPEKFRPSIVGKLPFEEIGRAYKGYRFGVNINTIKQSQSMFARRVFELAASNTLVVSNYSRGMGNFFGDLVLASDDGVELAEMLAPVIGNELVYRKKRLSALRYVMGSHTSRQRLEFVRSKIWGLRDAPGENILVIGGAADNEQAKAILRAYDRQRWPGRSLLLHGRASLDLARGDVMILPDLASCMKVAKDLDYEYICAFYPQHWYGEWYLADLALSFRYSFADFAGKGARYVNNGKAMEIVAEGSQYRPMARTSPGSSLWRKNAEAVFWQALHGGNDLAHGNGVSIDEFNFVENGSISGAQDLAEDNCNPYWQPLVESLATQAGRIAKHEPHRAMQASHCVTIPLDSLIRNKNIDKVALSLDSEDLLIESGLEPGRMLYIYGDDLLAEQVNLKINNQIRFQFDGSLDLKIAFFWKDKNNKKLGSRLCNMEEGHESLPIPADCEFVQLAIRICGPGSGRLKPILSVQANEVPPIIYFRSDSLLICAENDLHEAVNTYSKNGDLPENMKYGIDIYALSRNHFRFGRAEGFEISYGSLDYFLQMAQTAAIKNIACYNLASDIMSQLENMAKQMAIHGRRAPKIEIIA